MIVPKPQKMTSGNYYVRLRLGGKGITVTESTEKKCRHEAERIKAEWLATKRLSKVSNTSEHCTLTKAIDDYIESKSNILSPSTIRGYRTIQKSRFISSMELDIFKIKDWQKIVNVEAKICSPKTVKNAWGFIASVIEAKTKLRPRVTLPQDQKHEKAYLTPEQIKIFVKAIEGTDIEIPSLLGLCSLRCSEIMGLRWQDVNLSKSTVTVRASKVRDENGEYVFKQTTKTSSSARTVPIMPQLITALTAVDNKTPDEFVCTMHRNTLYKKINAVCEKNSLPLIGVHGLRHSFASLAYSLNIPYKVAMEIGGWSDAQTMQNIYTHISQNDITSKATEILNYYKSM